MNNAQCTPSGHLVDPRFHGLPIQDRTYQPTLVDLHMIRELFEEQTKKLRADWEREKNPHIAMGPYFYAVTLTVSAGFSLEQQKTKLLKMLQTLLRGKSIAQKYRVVEDDCFYVWELTQVGTLHIHLLVKTLLPAKHYDIRKVSGMAGANWQELKSYQAWDKYLIKSLDDPKHIEVKNKLALQDKLPDGEGATLHVKA